MKKYIIANWKANKLPEDVTQWLASFKKQLNENSRIQELITSEAVELIICPSFPYLMLVSKELDGIKGVSVGAQTIASIEHGSFTGEVTAEQIAKMATHVIIGHSERRTFFHENEEAIQKKTVLANQLSLQSILCIRGAEDTIYPGVSMVAFEPVAAIGSGQNMPVDQVIAEKKTFSNLSAETPFLYGGSVTPESARSYLSTNEINGLLIGSASLQAESFLAIAAAA